MRLIQIVVENTHWSSSKEQFDSTQAAATETGLDFELAAWEEDRSYQVIFLKSPSLVSEAELTDLHIAGVSFRIEGTKELSPDPEVLFNPKVPEGPSDQHFNNRVEVHMPGQALSIYNETLLMEDSCTDALQNELANGWRIIAVCPQPDQRRPDYVLGRYNPNVGVDTEAKRG